MFFFTLALFLGLLILAYCVYTKIEFISSGINILERKLLIFIYYVLI